MQGVVRQHSMSILQQPPYINSEAETVVATQTDGKQGCQPT